MKIIKTHNKTVTQQGPLSKLFSTEVQEKCPHIISTILTTIHFKHDFKGKVLDSITNISINLGKLLHSHTSSTNEIIYELLVYSYQINIKNLNHSHKKLIDKYNVNKSM